MLRAEWNYLLTHKRIIVVLLAIALIPAIYCYLYLSSMWNTYGHTDKIPVSIVNEDKSVNFNGKTIAIGNHLTTNLQDKDSFDYREQSASQANRELKDGNSYMTIIIPKDFSKNATTLLSDNPQKMNLRFKINSGQNFIVSKMTTGAASAIHQKVSQQVTNMYSKVVLNALAGANAGMNAAASGSAKLAAAQLNQPQLAEGSSNLSDSLATGANKLSTINKKATNANHIADPVSEHVTDIAKVPNNGTGMAPFAIAIGLYVGGIALGTMFDGFYPHKKPNSAISWWFSKTSVIAAIGVIQSTVLYFTLINVIHLTVLSQFNLFVELLLGSWLFLSLIFCLRILLGGFGTWLVSIVLVMQLASSGGLYPTELISPFAKSLNLWMPMTYLINSLRSTISTGLSIQASIWMMIALIIVFNLILIYKFTISLEKNPLIVA